MAPVFMLDYSKNDPMYDPALENLQWEDFWPRSYRCGGSAAYLGAFMICLVTKPFTPGEDAVVAWAHSQDGAVLTSIYSMADGRDILLLDRLHTQQSRHDAVQEQKAHLSRKLESYGIPVTVV